MFENKYKPKHIEYKIFKLFEFSDLISKLFTYFKMIVFSE